MNGYSIVLTLKGYIVVVITIIFFFNLINIDKVSAAAALLPIGNHGITSPSISFFGATNGTSTGVTVGGINQNGITDQNTNAAIANQLTQQLVHKTKHNSQTR